MVTQSSDLRATSNSTAGSLLVVGSGIQWAGHATLAAQRSIATADCVLFAVADAWTARWIRSLNPAAESLPYPAEASSRRQIYSLMVEQILSRLRQGGRVCVVFYGSPAVLTQPAHDVVRRAIQEGFAARMLPGISFLECLFTDLSVDPGEEGCHFLDAGVFLREGRLIDTRSHVVLSQIGLIRKRRVFEKHDFEVTEGLDSLSRRLRDFYPGMHACTVYEAATQPLDAPRRDVVSLDGLSGAVVSAVSTLYVPPLAKA